MDFRRALPEPSRAVPPSRGCRDHDIADMCQDVFVSLISRLKGFTYDRSRGRFRGYLLRCVQHALAKKMGRDTRAPALLEVWDPPAEEDPVWHAIWRQEYVIDLMRQARGQTSSRAGSACLVPFSWPGVLARTAADIPEPSAGAVVGESLKPPRSGDKDVLAHVGDVVISATSRRRYRSRRFR